MIVDRCSLIVLHVPEPRTTNNAQRTTNMSKVKITLIKSPIDKSKRQKDTLKALGFRKVNQTVEHENNPQIAGMVRVVNQLVRVENA